MGRKRKAGDGGKMSDKSKTPKLDKSEGEEKEHSDSAQTTSESKDVENNKHSPSNNLSPEHANEIEHNVESENLVEKGKEEIVEEEKEEPNSYQRADTEPSLNARNMEPEVCRTTNAEPSSELSYKSMYISSQKQVEYLMAENCRLSMKLEFAHGKIEAYEKVNASIHMTKDAMLNATGNGDSAPDADDREASREKKDSKKASTIAKNQKKGYRLRRKNC